MAISEAEAELELRDELGPILRELRGELVGIRARLDSLGAIEKEVRYHGQRLSAIEQRFGTLVTTTLSTPLPPAAALYAFMGWLTSRQEVSGPFSATHQAAPVGELVRAFCQSQGYADLADGWEKSLRLYPAGFPSLPVAEPVNAPATPP